MKSTKSFRKLGKKMLEPEKAPATFSKEELKKARPEIYNDALQDGVMLERKRIKELTDLKKEPGYKKIPAAMKIIDEAILNGTPIGKVNTLIMGAVMDTVNDPSKMLASLEESPPHITGFGVGQPEIDIPGAPLRDRAKEEMIHEV